MHEVLFSSYPLSYVRVMSTESERNARLDKLAAAVTTWASSERERLQKEVATAKKILQGHTGAERLADQSLQTSADLVAVSINEFLTG